MVKMSLEINIFNEVRMPFIEEEKRAPFFDMSSNLLKSGFKKEAYILLLSTWNFAYFRYIVNKFDLKLFERSVNEFENTISAIRELRFSNLDFDDLTNKNYSTIVNAFDSLNSCKFSDESGTDSLIGITGTTKLMHLMHPDLFIIWDGYIRGSKPERYYNFVDSRIIKAGWKYRKYKESGDGYFSFLRDMKEAFSNVIVDYEKLKLEKPVTKAIDEFNYMGITKPIMAHEKEIKEEKKKRKKENSG